MSRVLVVSGDRIDRRMGGMGVRYWELARALAGEHQVVLAHPGETTIEAHNLGLVSFELEAGDLSAPARAAEVVVTGGSILHFHPYLAELGVPLAIDLYVPYLLESLVWHDRDSWSRWLPQYEEFLRVQAESLRAGDFFFCASDRQRDYWLGWLHALKRINPHTYRADPSLRRLIDVVPFGLPEGRPTATGPVLRGVDPRFSPDDEVLLWSGGLWDWLDPLTVLEAVAELVPSRPHLKLCFMGMHHPNPLVTGMQMPGRTVARAKELGLYERHAVFFDWTPYERRVDFLLESNLAVLAHPGHIETRFAHRTRVLDAIWADLPIVSTTGDALADLVESHGLGRTVAPGDAPGLARAIAATLDEGRTEKRLAAFRCLQSELTWKRVAEPLARFCAAPSAAADRGAYLSESERLRRDLEQRFENMVRDKDDLLAREIANRERRLEQIITDKDAHLASVIADKDAYFDRIVGERDEWIAARDQRIRRYEALLGIRLWRRLKRLFSGASGR